MKDDRQKARIITRWMAKHNYNQSEAAKLFGVHVGTMSKWLNRGAPISRAKWARVCQVIGESEVVQSGEVASVCCQNLQCVMVDVPAVVANVIGQWKHLRPELQDAICSICRTA